MRNFWSSGFKLLFSLLLCLSVAVLTSYFTKPGEWYHSLQKPTWTPPNQVFGAVWLPLYVMMGLSLWLVWMTHNGEKNFSAYVWFFLQLAFNFAWPIAFFTLQCLHCGLIISFFLLLSLYFCIKSFYRRSKLAAYLLVPYFAWVVFATALNGFILYTNPPPHFGQFWGY